MNPRNLGYQFETEFGRWLKTKHPFMVKLPDTRSLRFKAKVIESVSNLSFHEVTGTKTPGDFWSVNKGISYLWECKHTMQQSLPYNRIADHQLGALEGHYNAGGYSFLVIGHQNKEAYIINIAEWIQLERKFSKAGRKSVPLEWIKKMALRKLERKTPKHLEGENKPRYVEVKTWE